MAAENDILTGLDISSLTSVEQSQILQMINQAAPLVNKGLIIYQSSAVAGVPDVVNNTRYARYIWLDTVTNPPTPKIYDGAAWQSLVVGAGQITNAMVNAAAAIAITKLAFGTARYIVRTNAAGNALEYVNPNSIFTNNDVPLVAVDSTGAPAAVKSYLQRNATTGITAWQQIAFADFAAGDLLAVAKIAPGTDGYVLGTTAGAVAWATLVSLIADNSIGVAKLTGSTGALQTIRRNIANNANEWAVPVFSRGSVVVDGAAMNVNFPAAANTTLAIAHGLGATPTLIWPVIVSIIDDSALNGWIINDEIPFTSLFDQLVAAGDARGCPAIGIGGWDGTNVYVSARNMTAGDIYTFHKTNGTAATNHCAVVTRANWKVKLYCYA